MMYQFMDQLFICQLIQNICIHTFIKFKSGVKVFRFMPEFRFLKVILDHFSNCPRTGEIQI